MENKTIEWGWEKYVPHEIRGKEHQEFLISFYNANRPKEEQVSNMAELNRALLDNEIKALNTRKVLVTERRVYYKMESIEVDVPNDIDDDGVADWLQGNDAWEYKLDDEIHCGDLGSGTGVNDNPQMTDASADRETIYTIMRDGVRKTGGHL